MAAFDAVAAKFPGRVTRVPWTPRDEHGFVTYGQNEALRHYVDSYGGESTWCCFTDLDEYVFSPSGRDLRRDLEGYAAAGVTLVDFETRLSWVYRRSGYAMLTNRLVADADEVHRAEHDRPT